MKKVKKYTFTYKLNILREFQSFIYRLFLFTETAEGIIVFSQILGGTARCG